LYRPWLAARVALSVANAGVVPKVARPRRVFHKNLSKIKKPRRKMITKPTRICATRVISREHTDLLHAARRAATVIRWLADQASPR